MSTIPRDEQTLRDMLSAYDAGQPPEAFRAQLHNRLRAELRHARRATTNSAQKTARPVSHRWYGGFVTAALVLAIAGVMFNTPRTPRETADRPMDVDPDMTIVDVPEHVPAPLPAPHETDRVIATNDIVTNPEQELAVAHDLVNDAVNDVPLEELVPQVPPVAFEPPMQFVLHSDAPDLSPDERRWRRAWCLLEDTTEPAEVFERWQSECEHELEESPENDLMAYRIQSALLARPELQTLLEPLLDSEAGDAPLVNALASENRERVNQMLAQFSGEMATSAKQYLELLLRSREDDGIAQLETQLHHALASEQLDDSRRDLVRRWIVQLESEKERRENGPVMM